MNARAPRCSRGHGRKKKCGGGTGIRARKTRRGEGKKQARTTFLDTSRYKKEQNPKNTRQKNTTNCNFNHFFMTIAFFEKLFRKLLTCREGGVLLLTLLKIFDKIVLYIGNTSAFCSASPLISFHWRFYYEANKANHQRGSCPRDARRLCRRILADIRR